MTGRTIKILALVITVLAWSGQGDHEAHARKSGYAGTIIAFGDSLTAGHGVQPDEAYPALLERTLQARGYPWKVINAGIRGETSDGALMRVEAMIKLKPDIVILETGANDSMRNEDLHRTGRNIGEIVRTLQDNRVIVILAGMRSMNGYPKNPAFAELYPSIARKYGCILVPFFLDHVAGNPALNIADGIHPTAEGYRIITSMIFPYVEKAIRQRTKVRLVK